MLKRMVLWGATGHAKVLREFIGELGYEVVAVFDNDPSVAPCFVDVPLFYGQEGFDGWKTNNNTNQVACLVAIGGARGRDRLAMQEFLEGKGLFPAVVVHPFAYVAKGTSSGKGSQILARAFVGVDAKLGDACIINTGASVDHECVLGAGVHLAPGAVLTGLVRVGEGTLIGPNAVVLPRISIGRDVIVGAGSVVTRDVPDNVVVYGNPARIQRMNRTDAK
jgi:sugar O-acyltransferase (sialic acid O-acetyltransferase NeuD family)